MSKGLLIYNEKAGSTHPHLLPALLDTLAEVEMVPFEALAAPAEVVRCARERGCDWVAAAGGDGTIGAIAAALVGAELPLGLIPVGTFNNFARSLHVPLDPVEACHRIRAGRRRPVDVGFANGRPFFECLGAGLDAALFPAGEAIKSGGLHRWFGLLGQAVRYPRHPFRLTFDRPVAEALCRNTTNESRRLVRRFAGDHERSIALSALMVTVSNGPYYGMNFAVAPEERMDDGLFTVSVFHRYSKLQLAWHFRSIARGRREYCPKAVAFRVGRVEITSPDEVPVHLDGTPAEIWPLVVECRPGAMEVF